VALAERVDRSALSVRLSSERVNEWSGEPGDQVAAVVEAAVVEADAGELEAEQRPVGTEACCSDLLDTQLGTLFLVVSKTSTSSSFSVEVPLLQRMMWPGALAHRCSRHGRCGDISGRICT
jgi:hypothetical protein